MALEKSSGKAKLMCWLLGSLLNCGDARHHRALQLLVGPQVTSALLCQVAFDAILIFPSETNKLRTLNIVSSIKVPHLITLVLGNRKESAKGKNNNKEKLMWNHRICFLRPISPQRHDSTPLIRGCAGTTVLKFTKEECKWISGLISNARKQGGIIFCHPYSIQQLPLCKAYLLLVKRLPRATS